MKNFYLLSEAFATARHAPFALATSLILPGLCGSRYKSGQIFRSVSAVFNGEQTLDGAEPAGHEIGLWKCHSMCDDIPDGPVPENSYFAWASTMFWDYDPPLVIYSKEEFMRLFEDCCRNYVVTLKMYDPFNPEPIDRSEEFAEALAANGMSLVSTAERP